MSYRSNVAFADFVLVPIFASGVDELCLFLYFSPDSGSTLFLKQFHSDSSFFFLFYDLVKIGACLGRL